MRHLDEGTVHAFLDGALSEGDAAAVESHLASCPSCAAAAAEARGFIAASSRILAALDGVPGGVVPSDAAAMSADAPPASAAPRRSWGMRYGRIAAVAAFVVAGTLIVVRYGGDERRVPAMNVARQAAPEERAANRTAAKAAPPAGIAGNVPSPPSAAPRASVGALKKEATRATDAPRMTAVPNAPSAAQAGAPENSVSAAAAGAASREPATRDSTALATVTRRTTIVSRSGQPLTLEMIPRPPASLEADAAPVPSARAASKAERMLGGTRAADRVTPDTSVTVLPPRAGGVNVITWRAANGTVYVLSGAVSVDELRTVRDSLVR